MTVDPVKEYQDRVSHSDLQKSNEVKTISEFAMDSENVPGFGETTTTTTTMGRMRTRIRRNRRETTHSEIQPKGSDTKQTDDDRKRKGSAETTLYKSPRSGEKVGSWTNDIGVVHHQILKIREEESQLGEDVLSTKEKLAVFNFASQMESFILSRPILPCSPLSGKTAIKTLH